MSRVYRRGSEKKGDGRQRICSASADGRVDCSMHLDADGHGALAGGGRVVRQVSQPPKTESPKNNEFKASCAVLATEHPS